MENRIDLYAVREIETVRVANLLKDLERAVVREVKLLTRPFKGAYVLLREVD